MRSINEILKEKYTYRIQSANANLQLDMQTRKNTNPMATVIIMR